MVPVENGEVMTEDEKTATAIKSIQEFEQMLNEIREQAWNEGYAAGVADRDAELSK